MFFVLASSPLIPRLDQKKNPPLASLPIFCSLPPTCQRNLYLSLSQHKLIRHQDHYPLADEYHFKKLYSITNVGNQTNRAKFYIYIMLKFSSFTVKFIRFKWTSAIKDTPKQSTSSKSRANWTFFKKNKNKNSSSCHSRDSFFLNFFL